jgi:hypothetical protein
MTKYFFLIDKSDIVPKLAWTQPKQLCITRSAAIKCRPKLVHKYATRVWWSYALAITRVVAIAVVAFQAADPSTAIGSL